MLYPVTSTEFWLLLTGRRTHRARIRGDIGTITPANALLASWGSLGGGLLEGAAGLVELVEGDGQAGEDKDPEGDEDGGAVLIGEAEPEVEDVSSVADAEPDRDAVADEAAEGEGEHELADGHLEGSGGEDERAEGHGRGQEGGERDGEDGVGFHPAGDALEDAGRGALLDEGHAAGLADSVGEPAAEGGGDGGEDDEEPGVSVLGGEEDEHDVGHAGEGEGDEGGVDDGDEEETDEAVTQEQLHEVGVVAGEEEEGGEQHRVETRMDTLEYAPAPGGRHFVGVLGFAGLEDVEEREGGERGEDGVLGGEGAEGGDGLLAGGVELVVDVFGEVMADGGGGDGDFGGPLGDEVGDVGEAVAAGVVEVEEELLALFAAEDDLGTDGPDGGDPGESGVGVPEVGEVVPGDGAA